MTLPHAIARLVRRLGGLLLVGAPFGWTAAQAPAAPGQAVATVLADFESDSTAPFIADVRNVLAGDCSAKRVPIPARGQSALVVEIGATQSGASIAVDLHPRVETRIPHPISAAVFCWINDGDAAVAFRIRDDRGHVFETAPQPVEGTRRWIRLSSSLAAAALKPVPAARSAPAGRPPASAAAPDDAPPVPPIEVVGLRIATTRVGRQAVFLDDVEVEQRVEPEGLVRAEYSFDQATHLYTPGATVKGRVELENGSREARLDLSVELAWLRADGTRLGGSTASLSLPPSTREFRSRQPVDFAQRIDEPGFYRLQTRVRSSRWNSPATFESTVLVTSSNRALPRGRSVFFGLDSAALAEPPPDQVTELAVARDVGAQLLALDAPWARLEPQPGRYELAALDTLLSGVLSRDIAPLIALSQPPDWAGTGDELARRQAALLEALVRHFGARVAYYQVLDDPATPALSAANYLSELRKRLAAIQGVVQIVTPPIRVAAPLPPTPPRGRAEPEGLITPFETSGDPVAAIRTLADAAERWGLTWNAQTWWLHRSEPLAGPGRPADAHAVLRLYVEAARAGVGSLRWLELRDATSDPRRPDERIGLARRDFSPRTTLLGYAVSAGMLSGMRYGGPLPGAPPEFDASLFLSSNRQVAVLQPRPNRVLPAVVAPVSGEPGVIQAVDFERQPYRLLESEGAPLALTRGEPFFVTIDFQKIRPEPQLELARPWLRIPATLFAGGGATVRLELDAPVAIKQGFVQLVLPQDAPYTSSLSSRRLVARAGETVAMDASLSPVAGREFEASAATLRVTLEKRTLEIPLTVRPLVAVLPEAASAPVADPRYRIGALSASANGAERNEELPLGAQWKRNELVVTVALPPAATPGDRFYLGLAAENADTHAEASISGLNASPAVEPHGATAPAALKGWTAALGSDPATGGKCLVVRVPLASPDGAAAAAAGARFLLAARYVRAGGPPLAWGRGLDGSGTSAGFRWIVLVNAK